MIFRMLHGIISQKRIIFLKFCLTRFPTSPFCTQNFTHRNVMLIHCTAVSMDVVLLDRMSLAVLFQTMIIIKYSATEVIFCFSEHQSSVSFCISVTQYLFNQPQTRKFWEAIMSICCAIVTQYVIPPTEPPRCSLKVRGSITKRTMFVKLCAANRL